MTFDDARTEYSDAKFTGLTQPELVLRGRRFEYCTFTNCAFTEAKVLACTFLDCTFERCDLSLSSVRDSVFTRVDFRECKLMGINWAEIEQTNQFFKPFDFTNCNLNYGTFIGLDLKKVRLVECSALDADFAEADLTEAICTGTDFAESRFLHTNLSQADFTNARNYRIVPDLNTLKGAKFSLPEALSLLRNMEIVIVDA